MVVDPAVVGECHANNKDQRQNGEGRDKEERGCHQQPVNVFIEKTADILDKIVDMTAFFGKAFGAIGAFQSAAPNPEHNERE